MGEFSPEESQRESSHSLSVSSHRSSSMNHNMTHTPHDFTEEAFVVDVSKEITSSKPPRASSSSSTEPEEIPQQQQTQKRLRLLVGLFLIFLLCFVVSDSLTNGYIRTGMNEFLDWVEENPGGGVVVFILVIFCTTLLFVPGVILTFGSGYVFTNAFGPGLGVLLGTIAVFVGAGAGAIVSFLLGRFLLRDCVAGLARRNKILRALDAAMEEKGLRIMVLLRLSPVIFASPYLNYGAGGTAISFRAYAIALLAILPPSVIIVLLGASAGSLDWIILLLGIVFTVFAVAVTTYYTRQELQKATAEMAQQQGEQQDQDDIEACAQTIANDSA